MDDKTKRQGEALAEAYMVDNVVEGGAADEMHNCMKDYLAGFTAATEILSDELEHFKAEVKGMDAGEYIVVYHPSHPNPGEALIEEFKAMKAQLAERDAELAWVKSRPYVEALVREANERDQEIERLKVELRALVKLQDQLAVYETALKQARNHAGWATNQSSIQLAYNCAHKAIEVINEALERARGEG